MVEYANVCTPGLTSNVENIGQAGQKKNYISFLTLGRLAETAH